MSQARWLCPSCLWPTILVFLVVMTELPDLTSCAKFHSTILVDDPTTSTSSDAVTKVIDPLPPHSAYAHLLRGDSLYSDTSTASTSSSSLSGIRGDEGISLGPVPLPGDGSWAWELRGKASDSEARAARVYCEGELLATVQLSGIFEDSKEFVDMPMLDDPENILQAFYDLSESDRANPSVIKAFVLHYFSTPGTDLVPHDPPDFTPSPSILEYLKAHGQYYDWAVALNQFWKQLVRKVPDEVFVHPERFSILRKNNPFVVPGGRFRESYYWDSYWIILGLLACDMTVTAKGLIQNLLDDVNTFGFVPNGGRIYYLNRSQPPLLSEMVVALLQADAAIRGDRKFVTSALAALDKEYQYWMVPGQHAVPLNDVYLSPSSASRLHHHHLTARFRPDDDTHVLNRYYTNATYPRPESYKEDAGTSSIGLKGGRNPSSIFADIAAGAESGWDFSSRWIILSQEGTYNLSNIATTDVIPVELNSFMYRMERNLARLHEFVDGNLSNLPDERAYNQWKSDKALFYIKASNLRAGAMDRFMWSEDEGMWKDYVIKKELEVGPEGEEWRSPGQGVVSVSSYLPMWSGILDNEAIPDRDKKRKHVLVSLQSSGLVKVGGVQTTTIDTGEQWDSPNAWSPIQQMVIEGLERLGTPEAKELAFTLAKEWLQSNYLGWANTGYMYEKYNALLPGSRGEGGEYYPQVGFGWSNGVVLHLLQEYGSRL